MAKACKDHLGVEYKSQAAMARAWGIDPVLLGTRLNMQGWDLEKALTTPHVEESVGKRKDRPSKPCTDHEGTEYGSIREMVDAWGVSRAAYGSRLSHGWTQEESLTGNRASVATKSNRRIRSVDHTGQEFESRAAMCAAWGVPDLTYKARIEAGLSVEEALTKPVSAGGNKAPCIDHTGAEFSSISEMCRAWGVQGGTFSTRMRRGYSLEEALTGERKGSPREKKIGEGPRKPGELKMAAGKPAPAVMVAATPGEDGRACSASAAARGVEKVKSGLEKRR